MNSGLCGIMVERSLMTQKVVGSNLGRFAFRQQPWVSRWHACASLTKQYNLVPAYGRWHSSAGKVTAGLAESNGSLPPDGWLKVTCEWVDCLYTGINALKQIWQSFTFCNNGNVTRIQQHQNTSKYNINFVFKKTWYMLFHCLYVHIECFILHLF